MKRVLVGGLVSIVVFAPGASDIPSKDELLTEMRDQFKQSQESGVLVNLRSQLVDGCEGSEEAAGSKRYCSCFAEKVGALSDEDLFYESITSYQFHQKKIEARMADDAARFGELDDQHKANSVLAQIDNACPR